MTILEKIDKRTESRFAASESGYILAETPIRKLLFASPHAYNRVCDAVRRVLGRYDDRVASDVALSVIYKMVDVKSNDALDAAVRVA